MILGALGVILGLGACSRAPQAAPEATPSVGAVGKKAVAGKPAAGRTAAPGMVRAVAPAAGEAPAPAAAPAAGPIPVGKAAATAAAATVAAPAPVPAGPRILSISTSPEVVHAGTQVVWHVRTSPEVASVTAYVSAYTLPLVRESAGRFALTFSVPSNVPGFFHGRYDLDVVARDPDGVKVDRTVSVSFQ
jgi:hypothetical protein